MSLMLFGELDCNRVPYTKALRRHVEKKIEEWLISKNLAFGPDQVTFRAVLTREGVGHTVECELTLASRDLWWSGYGLGRSPEDSVAKALSRMRQLNSKPRLTEKSLLTSFEPQFA